MTCKLKLGDTTTIHMKYDNPLFGEKNIYRRVDAEWTNLCKPQKTDYKPCEISITDRGGLFKIFRKAKDLESTKFFVKHFNAPTKIPLKIRKNYIYNIDFIT